MDTRRKWYVLNGSLVLAILAIGVEFWQLGNEKRKSRHKIQKGTTSSSLREAPIRQVSNGHPSPMLFEINENRYGTGPADHSLWVDRFLAKIPLPGGLAAFFIGSLVFSIGSLISWLWGFFPLYSTTHVIYTSCFGIGWTIYWMHKLSQRVHSNYKTLRPVFTVSDEEYRSVLDTSFRRIASDKLNFAAGAASSIVFLVMMMMTYSSNPVFLKIGSLRPSTVPLQWYAEPGKLGKELTAAFIGICCAALLGSALYILIVNSVLLRSLLSLTVLPIPEVVRLRLRPITNFHVTIAVVWNVGVALFVYLFFNNFDLVSIVIVATLGIIGMIAFAVPQIVFRGLVTNGYRIAAQMSLYGYYIAHGVILREGLPTHLRPLMFTPEEPACLANYRASTTRSPLWVYDIRDILLWLGAQLIVVATLLVQMKIDPFNLIGH